LQYTTKRNHVKKNLAAGQKKSRQTSVEPFWFDSKACLNFILGDRSGFWPESGQILRQNGSDLAALFKDISLLNESAGVRDKAA
jgi:hypothetical protein